MTREIKFRAWDEESSTMIYPGEFSHDGFYIECCDGKPFLMLSPNDEMDDGFCHPEHREKSVIMQFTGFQDSKGKEIYEGDILQFNNDSSVVRLIVFHQPIGGFGLKYEEKPERILPIIVPLTIERVLAYKIAGNKFENPELLEMNNA